MVDRHFADARLAALYDRTYPWDPRGDLGFYLKPVLAARSVLDVGCGTGMLLHHAREAGHTGRLCGLDPAEGMLAQARRRTDIEWVLGDLSTVSFAGEFDLVVMTGHAFQVFLTDEELRAALAAIHAALEAGGRFAFETRNPAMRAWERWTPDRVTETTDVTGAVVRQRYQAEPPVGDLVSFTTTYTSPAWERPEISQSMLRFLDAERLSAFLTEAGLVVEQRFGDWDGQPFTATSPEIITFARRAG